MKSQVISKKQDLTHLSWAKARQSSGTAGSFLKSYDDTGTRKVYYKLSDYDVVHGIVGHECKEANDAALAAEGVGDDLAKVVRL